MPTEVDMDMLKHGLVYGRVYGPVYVYGHDHSFEIRPLKCKKRLKFKFCPFVFQFHQTKTAQSPPHKKEEKKQEISVNFQIEVVSVTFKGRPKKYTCTSYKILRKVKTLI